MRIAKAVALVAAVACTWFIAASPSPVGACTFTRIPGPCTLHCINGVSCTGTQYCIFDSCGTGIICDGRAYNCRI
jgi:hypothetical protein